MTECLFCRIIDGQIPADVVHQTDDVLAFRDIHPRAATHVLVIPRAHRASLAELGESDPALLAELFLAAREVARLEQVEDSGYRLVSNIGADAGQEVDHVHVHVLGGQRLGPVARPRD